MSRFIFLVFRSVRGLESPAAGKAGYHSAVCLETGEEEWMELEGNSNSGTSAAFLERLRQRRSGPLGVIWDNAPAHRGEAVREYLRTPGLGLRLVNPRFHEGRLCRATARTEAPMRPSGAGRERKPPETCAWEPRPWQRRGSGISSAGCPSGKTRSRAAAALSCNQGPKDFCENPSPIPDVSQMHIPPWLWFSITTTNYQIWCLVLRIRPRASHRGTLMAVRFRAKLFANITLSNKLSL